MSSRKNKKKLQKEEIRPEEEDRISENNSRKKEKNKHKSKDKVKNRSIAVQLSLERISDRFFIVFFLDIFFAASAFFGFFYYVQREYSKSLLDISLGQLTVDHSAGSLVFIIESAKYTFTDSSGIAHSVNVGNFFVFMFYAMFILLTIELISFLISCIVIPLRINKRLKPLYTMSEAARVITRTDPSDETYATLQDAINKLSPSNPNDKLHTGRKELVGLESAVNDMIERMRNTYKSQNRFVSDASHELRTPIAVIQGYANMLDRWGREDPEILEESISAIKSEADNMNRLVENLLFLARGDSGKTNLHPELVDINQLMIDIYDEFVMIDDKHEFRLDLRASVKSIIDISLIKQCMRILIDNAVKYSTEGSDIILRLQMRGDNFYSMEVQDYGIGIKQEDSDKVFERFYRSDPARNRQTGGSGLGLSIAKWIADKHSGHIELLSYEDLGTRLSLVLPLKVSEPKEIFSEQ